VDVESVEPLDGLLDRVARGIDAHEAIDERPACRRDEEAVEQEVDDYGPQYEPEYFGDGAVGESDGVRGARDEEKGDEEDGEGWIVPRPLVLRLYRKQD